MPRFTATRVPTPHPAVLAVIGIAMLALSAVPAQAGTDWNDAAISWKSYESGLAEAEDQGKPVCLVFYTEWCPHCARYSAVFQDSAVVEMSKSFVMIRVERDSHRELSRQYAPDGEYIPRTYFLTSKGELRPEIHERRSSYLYFYDEDDPKGILRGMRKALGGKAGKPAAEPQR